MTAAGRLDRRVAKAEADHKYLDSGEGTGQAVGLVDVALPELDQSVGRRNRGPVRQHDHAAASCGKLADDRSPDEAAASRDRHDRTARCLHGTSRMARPVLRIDPPPTEAVGDTRIGDLRRPARVSGPGTPAPRGAGKLALRRRFEGQRGGRTGGLGRRD